MTPKPYVILIHGLLRNGKCFGKMAEVLKKDGYKAICIDYPSRKFPIEELAENYLKPAIAKNCPDQNRPINFVTHSLGGILLRYFLSRHPLKNIGRVVMLAPPNHGSALANLGSKIELVNHFIGPVLVELKTSPQSFVNNLPEPNYPVGIIAAKNDGKVKIPQTKLKNMHDFKIVSGTHSFIMYRDDVAAAVKKFFENGKF